jgi:hypothetical protein
LSADLEGSLEHFQPAEVLQLLQLAQATGRFELQRPPADPGGGADAEIVEIFFEGGRPLAVRTSGHSVRTGEILVHRGQARPEAVASALEAQRRGEKRHLGELLAARGAACPEDVIHAVHEGMRRILYGALLWRVGRFRFHAGERSESDLPLDLDLDRVILEGLRLADQARSSGS